MDCSQPSSSVHGIPQAGIMEWVARPSSGGSSRPRGQTQVSCIAGRFFTIWATRETSRLSLLFSSSILETSYSVLHVLNCSVLSDSLWPMDCSLPGFSVHGDSSGKNTEVGCHALLQGIFLAQGLNQGLPHCKQILYHLSHQGSPRILGWIDSWLATREAQYRHYPARKFPLSNDLAASSKFWYVVFLFSFVSVFLNFSYNFSFLRYRIKFFICHFLNLKYSLMTSLAWDSLPQFLTITTSRKLFTDFFLLY